VSISGANTFATGTGLTTIGGSLTLTGITGGVLVSNGTGSVTAVAPGTSGNVLTSNGTTFVSQAPSGGVTTVLALSSDATANSTTTGVEITGLNKTLSTGTYAFQYLIRYQSSATTNGVKFGVNFTGTQTLLVASMRVQESTTAASTGAASQAASGGRLVSGSSTRTASTTAPNLGPTISVDTMDADMLATIEGLIIVTASGDLELWHGSETATASTVMAGTSLILTKTSP
jgi:hypothetical protein